LDLQIQKIQKQPLWKEKATRAPWETEDSNRNTSLKKSSQTVREPRDGKDLSVCAIVNHVSKKRSVEIPGGRITIGRKKEGTKTCRREKVPGSHGGGKRGRGIKKEGKKDTTLWPGSARPQSTEEEMQKNPGQRVPEKSQDQGKGPEKRKRPRADIKTGNVQNANGTKERTEHFARRLWRPNRRRPCRNHKRFGTQEKA